MKENMQAVLNKIKEYDKIFIFRHFRPDGDAIGSTKGLARILQLTYPEKKIYLQNSDFSDYLAFLGKEDEILPDGSDYEIFDPEHTWKRKTLDNFTAEELLVPIFKGGKQVYELPSIHEIRAHCAKEIEGVWEEVRRFSNPHNYYVDLSEKLWDIKHDMLKAKRR